MIVKTGFHMERGRGGNEKELKKTVQIAIYHVIGGERRRMQQAHKTFKYKNPGSHTNYLGKGGFHECEIVVCAQKMTAYLMQRRLRCRVFPHTSDSLAILSFYGGNHINI